MQSGELFRLALGVQAPWRVTDVTFSSDEGRLDIRLVCNGGWDMAARITDIGPSITAWVFARVTPV